jgi:hypothetical protein
LNPRCGPAVRSCTCRRASRSRSRSGLLPHQHREHGPVQRALIIADEGSSVHYIEGCTAPAYSQRFAALRGRRG